MKIHRYKSVEINEIKDNIYANVNFQLDNNSDLNDINTVINNLTMVQDARILALITKGSIIGFIRYFKLRKTLYCTRLINDLLTINECLHYCRDKNLCNHNFNNINVNMAARIIPKLSDLYKYYYIDSLYVLLYNRGTGNGNLLLFNAYKNIKTISFTEIHKNNFPALCLFQKHGFVKLYEKCSDIVVLAKFT